MEMIDLLQDIAFNTGHRIISAEEATKDCLGMLVVQKKGEGYKTLFFDLETKVILGVIENIEINLHDPKSINTIRGYLISSMFYNESRMTTWTTSTAHTHTVSHHTPSHTHQIGYHNLRFK